MAGTTCGLCEIYSKQNLSASVQDIERLVWRASDMLRYFEKYDNIMASADVPIDVGKAEELISNHQKLHSLIAALSIEAIEADVEQV